MGSSQHPQHLNIRITPVPHERAYRLALRVSRLERRGDAPRDGLHVVVESDVVLKIAHEELPTVATVLAAAAQTLLKESARLARLEMQGQPPWEDEPLPGM